MEGNSLFKLLSLPCMAGYRHKLDDEPQKAKRKKTTPALKWANG
jgi:hypothetical protein